MAEIVAVAVDFFNVELVVGLANEVPVVVLVVVLLADPLRAPAEEKDEKRNYINGD